MSSEHSDSSVATVITVVAAALAVLFVLLLVAAGGFMWFAVSRARIEQVRMQEVAMRDQVEAVRQAELARQQLADSAAAAGTAVASSERAISVETPLEVGQHLQAREGDQWYPVEVLQLRPDGRVRVRWIGSPTEREELLPRERLQLGAEK